MKITSDYPGGNIIYRGINEDNGVTEIFLEQDMRDTDRWWFYWNFRIDSPPEGKVRFSFMNKDVVCPYGAAVSEDGINWAYDPDGYEDGTHFTYTFDRDVKAFYFCFTLPYQLHHFERFFESISSDGAVRRETLCVSEQGIDVPLLVIGEGKEDVVFTARHHCCESTASYALEGVIEALLNDYRSLLEKYRFHIIPFMDIDGAENGDQGKSRKPHDHNRDYIDEPIYSTVRALCEYARKLNTAYFIDYHSPWRWGGADSRPHLHLTSYVEDNDEIENRFVDTLRKITDAPDFRGIKYDGYVNHYGAFGNNPVAECADSFFKQNLRAKMALTIETPYSGDLEKAYTLELLREWGGNIVKALSETF